MNQNIDNESFTDSLEDNQSQLLMRLDYRVGKGAAWGDYDFWVAVLTNLTAGVILIPVEVAILALAKKIAETLKSSRAEKDEFQSSRFDLFVLPRSN